MHKKHYIILAVIVLGVFLARKYVPMFMAGHDYVDYLYEKYGGKYPGVGLKAGEKEYAYWGDNANRHFGSTRYLVEQAFKDAQGIK